MRAGGAGPPQLGGLFAGGMPKLRPAGTRSTGAVSSAASTNATNGISKAASSTT